MNRKKNKLVVRACRSCAGAAVFVREMQQGTKKYFAKKFVTLLDLCVSSLRRGHANLLCIVPILTDDLRRGSTKRPGHPGSPVRPRRPGQPAGGLAEYLQTGLVDCALSGGPQHLLGL